MHVTVKWGNTLLGRIIRRDDKQRLCEARSVITPSSVNLNLIPANEDAIIAAVERELW